MTSNCDVTKMRTPRTNDQHMSLYENPQWKLSAYANDQHAVQTW